MRRFRYVPHTADVEFFSYGPTLKAAIENAALAMINVMLDIRKISRISGETAGMRIRESAPNTEELVWFTLQDILSKIDERKLNAFAFKISKISTVKGRITLLGHIRYKKSGGDLALLSVKAVTPHGLRVAKRKEGCSIHVVIDV